MFTAIIHVRAPHIRCVYVYLGHDLRASVNGLVGPIFEWEKKYGHTTYTSFLFRVYKIDISVHAHIGTAHTNVLTKNVHIIQYIYIYNMYLHVNILRQWERKKERENTIDEYSVTLLQKRHFVGGCISRILFTSTFRQSRFHQSFQQ